MGAMNDALIAPTKNKNNRDGAYVELTQNSAEATNCNC